MNAVCPACGVAVVPGYVRCPKCQAPLPGGGRRASVVAGGTAVEGGGGKLPILPILLVTVAALAAVLYFVLRRPAAGPVKPTAQPTAPVAEPRDDDPDDVTPAGTEPTGPESPNRVDPERTARDLERALKNQRLWSTVEVVNATIEVHSGSCRDANMMPMIDAARGALRNVGMTRVKCFENSGAIVFERDL